MELRLYWQNIVRQHPISGDRLITKPPSSAQVPIKHLFERKDIETMYFRSYFPISTPPHKAMVAMKQTASKNS